MLNTWRSDGMTFMMKRLGIVAGIGVALIFAGLVTMALPAEAECVFCGGEGKTDCLLCVDGTDDCWLCDGTGWDNCIFCEDGTDDCVMCVNGTCDACDGAGGEICTNCGGTGERPYGACVWCDGTGWDDCYSCEGTGECSYCNGQGWETCTFCNGEGGENCSECGGDGLVSCVYCNGRGWDTCTFCNGRGKEVVHGLFIIPGGAMMLVGISLMPTALIVSRKTEKPAPPSPPPITRVCIQCGQALAKEEKFCPNCGKELKSD